MCYQPIRVGDSEWMVIAHLVTVAKLVYVRETQRGTFNASTWWELKTKQNRLPKQVENVSIQDTVPCTNM